MSSNVHVVLVGRVAHRPRALNPVGEHVMRGRCIPVERGGVRIGFAVSEQYPVASEPLVRFEAELDAALVPADWAGRELAFESCEQSRSWPGPGAVRVILSAHDVAAGFEDSKAPGQGRGR